MKAFSMLMATVALLVMSGCNDAPPVNNTQTTKKTKTEVKVNDDGTKKTKTETTTEEKPINSTTTERRDGVAVERKIEIKDRDENLIKIGPLEVKK